MKTICAFALMTTTLCLAGCGTGSSSDIQGTDTTNWTYGSNVPMQTMDGVYSFIYSDATYSCSDGSVGTSPGGGLQLQVSISNGMLTYYQSAASSSSSQEKVNSTGARVISATAPSGPINNSGDFVTTSSSLVDHPSLGYLRYAYKTTGQFKGSSWSGKYEMMMYMQDYGVTCNSKSTFYGSRQ